MTRECANCGAKYSPVHVFLFAESREKTACAACGADLINRHHYRIWKRNFIAIALMTGIVSQLFLSLWPALFVLAAVATTAVFTFPWMLPVNRF